MNDPLPVMMVSPSIPYPPTWGTGARTYHLARQISRHHPLHLVCCAPSDHEGIGALKEICSEVTTVEAPPSSKLSRRTAQVRSALSSIPFQSRESASPSLQSALNEALIRWKPRIIQLELSHLFTLDIRSDAAIVLDEHNLEYEVLQRSGRAEASLLRQGFNRIEAGKTRRMEKAAWRAVDACLVTSEREAAVVARHAPNTPAVVASNGVDSEWFKPDETATEDDSIVFTGSLNYRPNLDAAQYLASEVLPSLRRRRPAAHLTIVGHGDRRDLDRLRRPAVTVTGWVPDVRPYLARASVVMTPLRIGSGTRLKVLDALSMEKAVVSTTIGCEGLSVRDGEHLVVADGTDRLADETAGLLADAPRRASLGRAGRMLVTGHYSWERSGAAVNGLFERITGTQRHHAGHTTSKGNWRG